MMIILCTLKTSAKCIHVKCMLNQSGLTSKSSARCSAVADYFLRRKDFLADE